MGKCTVCGGARPEHFEEDGKTPRTQHAYTENPGEIMTHEQKTKERQGQSPQLQAALMTLGGSSLGLGRLVEVLLDAGVIRVQDALYIAGFSAKPNPRKDLSMTTMGEPG